MNCCGSRTTQKTVRGHSHHGRRRTSRAAGVPATGGGRVGLLRMAVAAALAASDPPHLAHRADPRRPCRLSGHLRCSAGPCRADPRTGPAGGPQSGGDVDGPCGHQGPARHPAQPAPPRDSHRDGSRRAHVHPDAAKSIVGHRYHRTPHSRRQGLTAPLCWIRSRVAWSDGRSIRARLPPWSPTPGAWPSPTATPNPG